jgi:hypothetical protein
MARVCRISPRGAIRARLPLSKSGLSAWMTLRWGRGRITSSTFSVQNAGTLSCHRPRLAQVSLNSFLLVYD